MKLFFSFLVVFVSFDAIFTIGIFKTKPVNRSKIAHHAGHRHRLDPRKVMVNQTRVIHSPETLRSHAIGIRKHQPVHHHKDVHARQKDKVNRVLHPKFREIKTRRIQLTNRQKIIQRQHPVHPTRLLANNSHQQKLWSDMNHHYQEQIHVFFQNQHQHPPIPTRPRPKQGLRRRKK